MLSSENVESLLFAVGDLLKVQQKEVQIVVVGGTALNLLGLISRVTQDVDIIARMGEGNTLINSEPLPEYLSQAIKIVAQDFDVPSDWMNTEISAQWQFGLPPNLKHDIEWRQYNQLKVGLVKRRSLIALKLFAAVDRGKKSVHTNDLIQLKPSMAELQEAAKWVEEQDASDEFPSLIQDVIEYVNSRVFSGS